MKKLFCLITTTLLLSACMYSPPSSVESVPSRDYQRCLDAEQMGGGEAVAERCNKLSEEIGQINPE